MKTKDATKKPPQNRPKPYIPDFMPQQNSDDQVGEGAEIHTTDDIKEILNKPRV